MDKSDWIWREESGEKTRKITKPIIAFAGKIFQKNAEETPKPGVRMDCQFRSVRGSMGTYMPKYSFFVITHKLQTQIESKICMMIWMTFC